MDFPTYQGLMRENIKATIEAMRCQPILFVGTGISRRYFDAPNWVSLLESLCKSCPMISQNLPYYLQKHNNNYISVAEEFAGIFREWAWCEGRDEFPEFYFEDNLPPQVYLKFMAARLLERLTPKSMTRYEGSDLQREITAFQLIRPHALITTNYDRFLELCFPEYRCIVGQKVLLADHSSIGDIFKIHGCVTEPETLVLTSQDYDNFQRKQKYLGAKLFAYFAEHPVFFMGYSASDPNIRDILTDYNEMVAPNGELVENIYIVSWDKDAERKVNLPTDEPIPVGEGRHVRVRKIVTSNFDWVYEALAHRAPIQNVNVKLLRSLLSRVKQLVRSDIPSGTITVNYETIEGILEQEGQIENIFGISRIDDPRQVNINYPYSISLLAEKLDYKEWNPVKTLFRKVKEKTGKDICATDNKYHVKIKTGRVSSNRKYSEAAYLLLRKVKDGKDYEVDLPVMPSID